MPETLADFDKRFVIHTIEYKIEDAIPIISITYDVRIHNTKPLLGRLNYRITKTGIQIMERSSTSICLDSASPDLKLAAYNFYSTARIWLEQIIGPRVEFWQAYHTEDTDVDIQNPANE